MPLMIRNPRAVELARKLAPRRGQTMTNVVIDALEKELKHDNEQRPLADRLADIAREFDRLSQGPGREVTKEEMDSLWGHDDLS